MYNIQNVNTEIVVVNHGAAHVRHVYYKFDHRPHINPAVVVVVAVAVFRASIEKMPEMFRWMFKNFDAARYFQFTIEA